LRFPAKKILDCGIINQKVKENSENGQLQWLVRPSGSGMGIAAIEDWIPIIETMQS
jgi:hypothetical protein